MCIRDSPILQAYVIRHSRVLLQCARADCAWKLAKGLYIVPLLFAYSPLITGDFAEMMRVFCFALFGIYAIVAGLEGYLEHPLHPVVRLLMFPIGLLMLWPHGQVLLDSAGLVIFIAAFVWSSRRGRRLSTPAAA